MPHSRAPPFNPAVAVTCSEDKCRPDSPPLETGCSCSMAVGRGSGTNVAFKHGMARLTQHAQNDAGIHPTDFSFCASSHRSRPKGEPEGRVARKSISPCSHKGSWSPTRRSWLCATLHPLVTGSRPSFPLYRSVGLWLRLRSHVESTKPMHSPSNLSERKDRGGGCGRARGTASLGATQERAVGSYRRWFARHFDQRQRVGT